MRFVLRRVINNTLNHLPLLAFFLGIYLSVDHKINYRRFLYLSRLTTKANRAVAPNSMARVDQRRGTDNSRSPSAPSGMEDAQCPGRGPLGVVRKTLDVGSNELVECITRGAHGCERDEGWAERRTADKKRIGGPRRGGNARRGPKENRMKGKESEERGLVEILPGPRVRCTPHAE